MPSQEKEAAPEQTPNTDEIGVYAGGDKPATRNNVIVGLWLGILANLLVLLLTFVFSLNAAALPRGTHVKGTELGFVIFYIGPASFFAGVPLSLYGAAICGKSKDKRGMTLGVIGAVLNAIPYFIAYSLFQLIATLLGLNWSE